MFFFPLSLSLLHFFQSSPRPVKFLLSPPFNATSRIPNERTFHVLSIIADFTSHLQKSVHAQRALITGIEPFARFPRGIFPNRYCPLRFSPILHLSLSLYLCLVREEWEQRKRKKRAFTGIAVFACARSKPDARKGGEEHRFSAGGSAFASKRLTSATLQPRPIYTTIDREKPVNRKLVKFDP